MNFNNNQFIILLFLILQYQSQSLTIQPFHGDSQNQSYYFSSPTFLKGIQSFTIVAELVTIYPEQACDLSQINVSGKVVLDAAWFCAPEKKILTCQENGCLAIISSTDWPIAGNIAFTFSDFVSESELKVPLLEIGAEDTVLLLNLIGGSSANPIVSIQGGDSNSVLTAFKSWTFTILWTFILVPFAAFCVLGSAAQLLRFYRVRWIPRLALYCLIVELITNLQRCVCFLVDPFFRNQIIPFWLSRILLTISFPWSWSCSLAMAFFWIDALRTARILTITKKQLIVGKTLFLLLFVLVVFGELTTDVLYVYYLGLNWVIVGIGCVLALAQFLVMSIYILAGFRAYSSLIHSSQHKRLQSIGKLVLLSVCGMIIFLISATLVATPFYLTAYGSPVISFSLMLGIQITSVAHILIFTPRLTRFSESVNSQNHPLDVVAASAVAAPSKPSTEVVI